MQHSLRHFSPCLALIRTTNVGLRPSYHTRSQQSVTFGQLEDQAFCEVVCLARPALGHFGVTQQLVWSDGTEICRLPSLQWTQARRGTKEETS